MTADKTLRHQPKNDFHNLNYLTNEVKDIQNVITKGNMTQKKFAECKQQIKTLKGKVNLRFNKNKDSDKTILKDFENVCKKLETTAF